MKLARTLPRFMALILVLVLMVTAAQTSIVSEKRAGEPIRSAQQAAQETPKCKTIETNGSTVNIILHGLMVGRYKKGDEKRFEVGIVKRSSPHNFEFNVYEGGKSCKPIDCDPPSACDPGECDIARMLKDGKSWFFEVQEKINDVYKPITRDIDMSCPKESPSSEECADPTNNCTASMSKAVEEDYRNILNIEKKLHKGVLRRHLRRYKRPFKPVFYFHNGTVKTKCLTNCIEALRVERDGEDEGDRVVLNRIAEVVQVVISKPETRNNTRLVLKNNEGRVAWVHTFDDSHKVVEGRVLNLNSYHGHTAKCGGAYPCEYYTEPVETTLPDDIEDLPATDFQQYYYLVFNKNRPDRFELRRQRDTPKSYKITGSEKILAPPPYRCGMTLIEEGSKAIKFEKRKVD